MAGRPAVYFHVEFGVSWTPGQPTKSRQATYASRGYRNQPNQLPRRLQAATSNYLPSSISPDQRIPQQHVAHEPRATVENPGYYQEYYAPQYGHRRHHITYPRPMDHQHQHHAQPVRPGPPPHAATSRERRSRSRSMNRPSQERGRSAPPPANATPPWDAEPEPMTATILPSKPTGSRPLQANPTQFRLDDEDLPWSTTFPPGFIVPLDDDSDTHSSQPGDRGTFGPPRRLEERDRGRVTEIESLAAALMTVDNGFEDQWWNQGPRLVNIGGELKSAAALESMIVPRERAPSVDTAEELRIARARLGSIVSPVVDDAEPSMMTRRASLATDSPVPSIVDIVSPVSDSNSPIPSFRMVRRSMTTRSDELHM
ncbi:hypothetical protein HJFPF1_09932 [Paramyrothecium foliicola]|nr:hypothetical protein HJFPF1_09932 [Paramyrothecium foliicola]